MEIMPNQPTAEAGGDHTAAGSMSAGADRTDVTSPSPVTKQRSLRAVYVLNDGLKAVAANSPESGALQCLQRACDAESAILTTVTFGRLDFGETSVLDTFYDAGELHWRDSCWVRKRCIWLTLSNLKATHFLIMCIPC